MKNSPKVRTADILIQELDKELLVYDLSINKAYCLNETSALIFQLCDGRRSVTEIGQALSRNLPQPVSEDLIWIALDNFKRENLLEESDRIEIDFRGLARRQVIKRVGVASMIVLPMVSSVIAPRAAVAQSLGCSTTPLAPGCVIPGNVFLSNPCSPAVAFSYDLDCNRFYGSQCSSGKAIYQTGSCVDVNSKGRFKCVCA